MNLKLPLKTESVDAWNGVYLFDGNDIQIGRIYNRETAEELVSSVNSCSAMRGALEWIAQQPCESDEPDMECKEQNLCITEYCLPCYAKFALSSAPVDQQKERMKRVLEGLIYLEDELSGIHLEGDLGTEKSSFLKDILTEAAALLKEMEGK
jgi:hypothetical protein